MSQQKNIVEEAMNAFFRDFDEEKMRSLFDENYIQHNPEVPTGLAPILERLPSMKAENFGYTSHRIIEDDDLVVTHSTFHRDEPYGRMEYIAFDVWRVQGDKIVEHWDNIELKVEKTASGRSQVDGVTEIEDVEKTEQNKTALKNFIDDVILRKAPEKIAEYISSEQYDQHNPLIKDGLAGIAEAVEYYDTSNVTIRRILGEGNFMMILSEGILNGKNHAYFDLFRLKEGKMVEHWDVIQEIPSDMAHANGKF